MNIDFNPFSLEGKNIIITGASSGIGRQCAIDCSKMGAKVAILGRNEKRLNETSQQLEGNGHLSFAFDLSDSKKTEESVIKINESFGPLDGVVNCAGISSLLPFKLANREKMAEIFDINVISAMELTKVCLKRKRINPQGASVIFISSIMGVVGEKAKVLYSLTKGALVSGCRSLAVEYAYKKVRVNCISPGAIETPINSAFPYMADPELREELEKKHLLGLGKPDDISNIVIFLLSDAARWITGQNLIVDGGYTIQ